MIRARTSTSRFGINVRPLPLVLSLGLVTLGLILAVLSIYWPAILSLLVALLPIALTKSTLCRSQGFPDVGWLDGLPDSVAVIDQHGNIVAVNDKWRLFGKENGLTDQHSCVGGNYLSSLVLGQPADGEMLKLHRGITQVLDGSSSGFSQVYPCHSPTKRRWFRVHVLPTNASGLTARGFAVVCHQDICELRRAEESSHIQETRFRSLFHGSNQPMLLLNLSSVVDCNQAAKELFNADSQETLSAFPQDISEQLVRTQEQGNAFFEWECERQDGKYVPVEVYLTTLSSAGCESDYVLATLTDVSERKRLYRELQNVNARLEQDLKARVKTEQILRSTASYLDVYHKIVDRHAIVAETDNAGNIVHANDAFCRISGFTREELIGKNHRIVNSGVHPKVMWRDMFRQVVTDGVWHGEVCNRNKQGELYWVDTTVVPLLNEAGKVKGYFAIRTDITGLKKAQADAEAANIAKSEFLANMSHEIRTPMTAILGFADLIADESMRWESDKWREFVGTIKRNGEHLLAIINDILDLSKIEANKLVLEKLCANTRSVVDSVIELMMIKASGKGLQLRAQIDGNVPEFIHTDPTRLRQILLNLVGNAVKFTELGNVTLNVRLSAAEKDRLIFEVTDTGIGMTEEQKSRLFQAFEQADASMTRKFGGTGLGLRISERLASMLGGRIEVTSELNVGSTFQLTIHAPSCRDISPALASSEHSAIATNAGSLNRSSEAPQPTESQRTENQGTKSQGTKSQGTASALPLAALRILLVEDGPDNQRLISFLLKKAGAEVTIVDNGRAALEEVSCDRDAAAPLLSPAPFDVILMDMQMPIMDGYEATRTLRQKGWARPILALTAHAMSQDLEQSIHVGCNAHLTKPIDKRELINACASWARSTSDSSVEAHSH